LSAGHHSSSAGVTEGDLSKLLLILKIKRRRAQRPEIVRLFDVPYLGGYSLDGQRIYLDRHLRPVRIGGKTIDPSRFLFLHEHLEKVLIDELGWKYLPAHEAATRYEHRGVRSAGLDPKAYEAALKPYIKADRHERLTRVPPDLDLTPYRSAPHEADDKALLAHLRKVMDHPQPKLTKTQAHYGHGMTKTHCGNCRHFGNRNCEIVSGAISPMQWCMFWERE
jgi:hypothetical protein